MLPTQRLIQFGQSIWYDNISRTIIDNGELKQLIDQYGIRGLTSNPTIFDKAISKSSVYDAHIAKLKNENPEPNFIFEALAVRDVGDAADLLRGVYKESGGNDGFVSIEVSPLLAADTEGTVSEALRLFKRLNRPNIMIKVPGTSEGIPAIRSLLEQGVNVNVTLLFSVDDYVKVAKTYVTALQNRMKKGLDVKNIRSVASFFVSRVDTAVDKQLKQIASSGGPQAKAAQSLTGKFAVANSRVAYKRFEEIFRSNEFAELRKAGAAVQRPLWASTGTKDPAYSDVVYVDELIGPDTVNTVPHETLLAFADHGRVEETVRRDIEQALALSGHLAELGVDVKGTLVELQRDGVKKFAESFLALNAAIRSKIG